MLDGLKFWETPEARKAQKKRADAKKAVVKSMRKKAIARGPKKAPKKK